MRTRTIGLIGVALVALLCFPGVATAKGGKGNYSPGSPKASGEGHAGKSESAAKKPDRAKPSAKPKASATAHPASSGKDHAKPSGKPRAISVGSKPAAKTAPKPVRANPSATRAARKPSTPLPTRTAVASPRMLAGASLKGAASGGASGRFSDGVATHTSADPDADIVAYSGDLPGEQQEVRGVMDTIRLGAAAFALRAWSLVASVFA